MDPPVEEGESKRARAVGPAGARLALWLALATAVFVPLAFTDAPQDDAYISYRYARNWVDGHGLVFNAGEEPVEGYTNFLWTVLLGLGMRLGVDPEWLGPALGLVATLGAALLTARLARQMGADAWFAAGAVLLFAVQPTLTVHAVGGLETSFFALLATAGLVPRLRARRGARDDLVSSIALAAAALTRPEGILLFGLLEVADAAVALRARAGLRTWWAGALRRGLPFALVVGAHVLWRRATYGDWVPNTFHAKVAAGPRVWADGLRYVRDAVLGFGVLLFLAPYLAAREAAGRRARATCLWISTVWCLYVAYVGGDYMPTYRFFLPVLPVWCALAASSFGVLGERLGGRAGARVAGALLVVVGAVHTVRGYADEDAFWPEQAERHAELVAAGEKLDEILPEDAWIAITNAGRVPYFAKRRCLDMMGLSDRHIARRAPTPDQELHLEGHLKGDGRYVLERRPDVIVFLRLVVRPRAVAENPDWPAIVRKLAFGISESEIARDPQFRAYRMVSLPLSGVDAWLNVAALPGAFGASPPPGLIEGAWPSRD